ncbi:hypothetical protein GW17_00014666 [Ensete ventricosum]|nr:hypothetical protein GW17_00014666 [Ensete ventricosum]
MKDTWSAHRYLTYPSCDWRKMKNPPPLWDHRYLSPCDSRLSLSSRGAQLAVFRPKVDEISLLTVNTTTNPTINSGGFMVAFAGSKYAARSSPVFVGNSSYAITSFTLLAFSGTDKHDAVLNSWYEVSKLQQYSLYGLYSDLKNSLTTRYDNIF